MKSVNLRKGKNRDNLYLSAMTRYEQLIADIVCDDIMLIETKSNILPAHSMRMDQDYAIFFNEVAFGISAEKYIALAHEKAHCDTGALYSICTPMMTRGCCEQRAWRRTVVDRLPLDRLIDAFEACKTLEGVTVYSLSEYLDMPEAFIVYAIELYTTMGKEIL